MFFNRYFRFYDSSIPFMIHSCRELSSSKPTEKENRNCDLFNI